MNRLVGYVGLLLLLVSGSAAILAGQASMLEDGAIEVHRVRIFIPEWGLVAGSLRPFDRRDWMLVIAVLAFVALNSFLWTLPMSQVQLFFISLPLGVAGFVGFMWLASRK